MAFETLNSKVARAGRPPSSGFRVATSQTRLRIGADVLEDLGNPERVEVHVDRQGGQLAVSSSDSPTAHKLTKQGRQASRYISLIQLHSAGDAPPPGQYDTETIKVARGKSYPGFSWASA